MNKLPLIKPTPWDRVVFGIPTWEVLEYSVDALRLVAQTPGHYTLKVNPLEDKRLLHENRFYYCDTLLEPSCNAARLKVYQHTDAFISKEVDLGQALTICHGAFSHGRFHRDINLPKGAADQRYNKWLEQLFEKQCIYGLFWENDLAGFIGYSDNNLLLHAVDERYRGRGLAKYWWSAVCSELLGKEFDEVKSSISASNVAVINLYASLGFSFNNSKDVYHRLVD